MLRKVEKEETKDILKMEEEEIIHPIHKEMFYKPPNAMAVNSREDRVLVGGNHILKLFEVTPDMKLRALDKDLPEKFRSIGRDNIKDITWNPYVEEQFALVNLTQRVMIYNFNSASQMTVLPDVHKRMINKLVWHPQKPEILMTVSSDGTIRLFDIDSKEIPHPFTSDASGYFEAKFAPWNSNLIAAGKENGVVEIWDIRNPNSVLFQQILHSSSVSSLDWHPTQQNVLLTGSTDKHIKTFFFKDGRSAEQVLDIVSYSGISNVKWNSRYEFCVSFASNECDIFQYHIQAPSLPSAIFRGHREPVTNFNWLHSSNYLLTCSKDSTALVQHKSFAHRPFVHTNFGALCVDHNNTILFHKSPFVPCTEEGIRARFKEVEKDEYLEKKHGSQVYKDPFFHSFQNVEDFNEFSLLKHLISKYQAYGLPFPALCEHNAKVAKEKNYLEAAGVWESLPKIVNYKEEFPETCIETPKEEEEQPLETEEYCEYFAELENPAIIPSSPSSSPRASIAKQRKISRLEYEDFTVEVFQNVKHKEEEKNEYKDRLYLKKAIENIRKNTNKLSLDKSVDPSVIMKCKQPIEGDHAASVVDDISRKTIISQVQYFADRNDIVTATILALVLYEYVPIPNEQINHLAIEYKELLERFKMDVKKTELLKIVPVKELKEINEKDTDIKLCCPLCNKEVGTQSKHYCDNCNKMISLCCVCHEPVYGLYMWCQGCSHGGHMEHLKEWYEKSNECPTGCGHRCHLQLFLGSLIF